MCIFLFHIRVIPLLAYQTFGSYGTVGHALITSELVVMFPEDSLDLQSLTPLS